MSRENFVPSEIITSPKELPKEGDPIGFWCSLCDWTIDETKLHEVLPKFGQHNNEKHSDTLDAHLLYVYKRSRNLKNARRSLWRH